MRTLRLITFSRPTSLLAAQQRGFLEDEGIVLEVEDAKGSKSQMEGLAEGRWDLAHTNADNVMKFRQNGFEQFFIFFVLDLGMAQKVIVQPDVMSGGSAWQDRRGRRGGLRIRVRPLRPPSQERDPAGRVRDQGDRRDGVPTPGTPGPGDRSRPVEPSP
jgi:hypothetical protein